METEHRTNASYETMGDEKCPSIHKKNVTPRKPDPCYHRITRALRLIKACPVLPLQKALDTLGPEKLPSMHDLARIKQLFMNEGAGQYFNECGGPYGTIGGIDRPCFWTGEYLGRAPKSHPAAGRTILAKVDKVNVENMWWGPKHTVEPSSDNFTFCDEISCAQKCNYITGFRQSIRGLMVPILSDEDAFNSARVTDYGPFLRRDELSAVCLRHNGWHPDLSFSTVDSANNIYRVLRTDWLKEMEIL